MYKSLFLISSFLILKYACETNTDPIKLLLVDDNKQLPEPQELLIKSEQPEAYIEQEIDQNPVEQYYIKEPHPNHEQSKPKRVFVDVKVRNPSKYDEDNLKKRLDIDVKIKGSNNQYDQDEEDKKYKIKVKISKEPPKEEGVLVKIIKSAVKYTG